MPSQAPHGRGLAPLPARVSYRDPCFPALDPKSLSRKPPNSHGLGVPVLQLWWHLDKQAQKGRGQDPSHLDKEEVQMYPECP